MNTVTVPVMGWYRIKQDQSEFFPELDIRLLGEFHRGCEPRACKFRAVSGHLSLSGNQPVYRRKPGRTALKQKIEVART